MMENSEFELSDDSDHEYEKKDLTPSTNNALLSLSSRNHTSIAPGFCKEDYCVVHEHTEEVVSNIGTSTGKSETRLNQSRNSIQSNGMETPNRIHIPKNLHKAFISVLWNILYFFISNFRRDTVIVLLMLSSVIMTLIYHTETLNYSKSNINPNEAKLSLSWNSFDNLADIYSPMKKDIPFFWYTPGSAPNSILMEDIFVQCFHAKSKNSLSLGLETVRENYESCL